MSWLSKLLKEAVKKAGEAAPDLLGDLSNSKVAAVVKTTLEKTANAAAPATNELLQQARTLGADLETAIVDHPFAAANVKLIPAAVLSALAFDNHTPRVRIALAAISFEVARIMTNLEYAYVHGKDLREAALLKRRATAEEFVSILDETLGTGQSLWVFRGNWDKLEQSIVEWQNEIVGKVADGSYNMANKLHWPKFHNGVRISQYISAFAIKEEYDVGSDPAGMISSFDLSVH